MQRELHRTGGQRHIAAPGALCLRALTAIILIAAPSLAMAQPGPGHGCRIRLTPIDFGEYRALDSFPNLALGRIEVNCLDRSAFPTRVTVSAGTSGNPLRRFLAQGDQVLEYNIYVDPGRHLIAGDGTAGTVALIPRTRGFGRGVFILAGAIPARQAVMAGYYHDELRVELEF